MRSSDFCPQGARPPGLGGGGPLWYNPIVADSSSKTSLIICGDAGPARHVLLSRREIRVSWADSTRDARASIKRGEAKVLITRPKLADGDAIRLLTELSPEQRPPVLVLLKRAEWGERARFLDAGATDVFEHHDGERLLDEVSRLTKIQFARHRRVRFEAPGEAKVVGQHRTYHVTSRDLSITGIGLAGISAQANDALVKLTLLVEGRPATFWGRVTRSWNEGTDPMVGLRFIAMSEEERLELSGIIEPREAYAPPPAEVLGSLFEDLDLPSDAPTALRTADLSIRNSAPPRPMEPAPLPVRPDSRLAQPMDRLATEARTVKNSGDRGAIREKARSALQELGRMSEGMDEHELAELSEARAALLREYMSGE